MISAPNLALAANQGPKSAESHDYRADHDDGATQRVAPLVTIVNSPTPHVNKDAADTADSHYEPDKPFWLQWEFWTALGTIFLGVCTLALVYKTDGLIKAAEKSAARQLRAYLNPGDHVFVDQDASGLKFEARPTIKNFGQTPAYDVVFWGKLEHISPNVLPNFNFAVTRPVGEGNTVIGPTQSKFYSCMLAQTLSDQEVADLTAPNGAKLYLWGTVWYRDAFGQNRYTNFAFQCIWVGYGIPVLWRDLYSHNDAD